MAERLPDGNEQNLQQFVNQSPWDPQPVQRRIAERMVPLISPDAFVVDDVSFPKDGRMSGARAGPGPGRDVCHRAGLSVVSLSPLTRAAPYSLIKTVAD